MTIARMSKTKTVSRLNPPRTIKELLHTLQTEKSTLAVLLRFPTLLCLAQKAERMAPKNVLMGLISAVEHIGQFRQAAAAVPNVKSLASNRHDATLQCSEPTSHVANCNNTDGGDGAVYPHVNGYNSPMKSNQPCSEDYKSVPNSLSAALLQNGELLAQHWSLYDKIEKLVVDFGLESDGLFASSSHMDEIDDWSRCCAPCAPLRR